MRAAEFIFEALLHDTVKDIAIWISPHVDQQRQKPERNVSWTEINKILKRIKIVRPKLYEMTEFNQFYLRDNETNVELGCVMVDLHGTQDETPTVKYLLKINTVIRSATPQARTSPVVTVNAVINESANFVGTCVNSFDEDGECIIPGLYNDVSDFAVHEEEAKQISAADFAQAVGEINQELISHIGNEVVYLHDEDNDVYMIYDIDSDVHYFFKGTPP